MLVEVVSIFAVSVVRGISFYKAITVVDDASYSGVDVGFSMRYDDVVIAGLGCACIYAGSVAECCR